MQNDKITLKDLSIFTTGQSGGVFDLLDRTTTQEGRETLRQMILQPPANPEALKEVQETVRWWAEHPGRWTNKISNGTLVMLEKFFESADTISAPPSGLSMIFGSFLQKLFNRNQYTFVQFSLTHLADLLKGVSELVHLLEDPSLPRLLRRELESMQRELQHPLVKELVKLKPDTPYTELTRLSYRARREMKLMSYTLRNQYARIDAWHSLAQATVQHGWHFPELLPGLPVRLEAEGLYHPLLTDPVSYDIRFDEEQNFLLLTGANMSGKTTFMRALGVSALLAHLGCGVPARLKISFLEGVITNMHVEDNILKGESYFFAEVQRMKHTAVKLRQDKPHLVLMDELFKGTNVHDAYECTRAVVDGLLQRPHHLMILSTHLHEVAQHFSGRKDILFAYFVTRMGEDGSFRFAYELKPGISNDRIGYRILQQEGVLDLLKK